MLLVISFFVIVNTKKEIFWTVNELKAVVEPDLEERGWWVIGSGEPGVAIVYVGPTGPDGLGGKTMANWCSSLITSFWIEDQ